jgi:hypothetical protein
MAKQLSRGIDVFAAKVEAAVWMFAERESADLQNFMKSNAKWTDRTGHARQSLTAKPFKENPTTITIKLAHGSNIPYGVYLELAHEKKYAIIQPTIQTNQNQVMQDLQYLFDKLQWW